VESSWDDRLLSASFREAKAWTAENPITYSIVFGMGALIVQLMITAGFLRVGGVLQAVLSLFVVPVLIIGFMVFRTMLLMLYEVRAELGSHLQPASEQSNPENFTCSLAKISKNEFAILVANHDETGDFQVKVVELRGVEENLAPITLRWQAKPAESLRTINRDDSDVASVVRVRGRRAIDFLQPEADGEDRYQRVATAGNGHVDRPDEVAAVLRVFNRQAGGDGRQSHLLRLRFDNGSDTPTPLFESVADSPSRNGSN
jgi:hypothetical protein